MTPETIANWINILSLAASQGAIIVGHLKDIFTAFGVSHNLSDAEIDAIEQAAMADDQARIDRRTSGA